MKVWNVGDIAKELVTPVAKRLGVVVAVGLTTYGVSAEHADTVVNLLGALGAVAIDIAVVIWKRKRNNA